MNTHSSIKRWIAVGLLASTVLSLASPAFAGSRRRYKGVQSYSPVQRVVVRERSSAGPVLAGLIGGFILGAAVTSNAQPVVVHERSYRHYEPVYRYYDPYGDYWYESLDECRFRHGGPRVILVVDVRSGERVRTLRHHDGRWNRCDNDEYGFRDHGYRYDGYHGARYDRDDD